MLPVVFSACSFLPAFFYRKAAVAVAVAVAVVVAVRSLCILPTMHVPCSLLGKRAGRARGFLCHDDDVIYSIHCRVTTTIRLMAVVRPLLPVLLMVAAPARRCGCS